LAQLAVDVLTNTLSLPVDLVTPNDDEQKTDAPQTASPSEPTSATP
jgi:hypothetical protein